MREQLSSVPSSNTGRACEARGAWRRCRLNLDSTFADRTVGINANNVENALLTGIEARLAEEVRWLVGTCREFIYRAQLVSEELSERSHLGKAVALALCLVSLQFSNTLRKSVDRPILLDDGAEYLHELSLDFEKAFREVRLNGCRFLAIAFSDKSETKVFDRTNGANK